MFPIQGLELSCYCHEQYGTITLDKLEARGQKDGQVPVCLASASGGEADTGRTWWVCAAEGGGVGEFPFLHFFFYGLVWGWLCQCEKNRLLSAKSLGASLSEKWETWGALRRTAWVPSFRGFEFSVCLSRQ